MAEEEFEVAESGASKFVSKQAGHVKKGDYAMLKGHPCKVLDMSTSKAGKHGAAKASFMGVDIFTNKKYEDSAPTTHNMDTPIVTKRDIQLLDIKDDGYVSLMLDDGSLKEDLSLPTDTDSAKLVQEIRDLFAQEKEIVVTVISALDQEKIVGYKEQNKG